MTTATALPVATKLLVPLSQQYTPLSFANKGSSSVLDVASSSSSDHFDRSLDSTCNFAAPLTLQGHQQQQSHSQRGSEAENDICSVTWLPPVIVPPPPQSNNIRSTGGGIMPSSSSLATSAAVTEAWLLGILPNGSIRAVCPTSGSINMTQTLILAPTPSNEIMKNANESGPLFALTANHLVSFATPRGTVGAGAATATTTSASNTQQQQQQQNNNNQPPQPRGRGTVNPTNTVAQSASGNAASAIGGSLVLAGAPTTKNFANHRNMISVVCFRGGALHHLLLECPDPSSSSFANSALPQQQHDSRSNPYNRDVRNQPSQQQQQQQQGGSGGLKLVHHHSLGKHTSPPQDLFQSIETCSIEYYKMDNNNNNNTNIPTQTQQQLHRHFLLVHCRGRSAASSSDKISAVGCFELERKGQDSLVVDLTAPIFLHAVTRVQWTVIGSTASSSSQQQQSNSNNTNNDSFFSKCPPLVSLSILGHSSSFDTKTDEEHAPTSPSNDANNNNSASATTNDNNNINNTHLMIALAHSGAPASIRIASIKLPPLQSFARGEFYLSGQSLTVNSKHAIVKMTTLSITHGTSLIAVLTKDNFIQVFCSAFTSASSSSLFSSTNSSTNINSQDSRRRQRNVTGEAETQQHQQQSNEWTSNSLSSKCLSGYSEGCTATGSCWPLVTPRMKCPFPPVYTTLVCSIAAPAATLANPVDDIVLIPRTSTSKHGVGQISASAASASARNNIQSVSLVAALGSGAMQTFSILGAATGSSSELSRLEKTETKSILTSNQISWDLVIMGASSPVVVQNGEGKCLLAQVLGSVLVVLRPKKQSIASSSSAAIYGR